MLDFSSLILAPKYEARVWTDKEWDYSYTRMSTDDVDREIRNERIEGLGV